MGAAALLESFGDHWQSGLLEIYGPLACFKYRYTRVDPCFKYIPGSVVVQGAWQSENHGGFSSPRLFMYLDFVFAFMCDTSHVNRRLSEVVYDTSVFMEIG